MNPAFAPSGSSSYERSRNPSNTSARNGGLRDRGEERARAAGRLDHDVRAIERREVPFHKGLGNPQRGEELAQITHRQSSSRFSVMTLAVGIRSVTGISLNSAW